MWESVLNGGVRKEQWWRAHGCVNVQLNSLGQPQSRAALDSFE